MSDAETDKKKAAEEQAKADAAKAAEAKRIADAEKAATELKAAQELKAKQAEAEKAKKAAELKAAEEERARQMEADKANDQSVYNQITALITSAVGGTEAAAGNALDKLNIWNLLYKVTDWVNSPGVPNMFRQGWNWVMGALNTDAGRSIMLGLGILKTGSEGLGVLSDVVTGKKDVVTALRGAAPGMVVGGGLLGLGLQHPDGSPEKAAADAYRQYRQDRNAPILIPVPPGQGLLDPKATSTQAFNTAAPNGTDSTAPAPAPTAGGPTYRPVGSQLNTQFASASTPTPPEQPRIPSAPPPAPQGPQPEYYQYGYGNA